MRRQDQQQSRAFHGLSSLILNLLRSPTPIQFSDHSSAMYQRPPPLRRPPATPSISPAGFASLLLGTSLSLMLCGSVTFSAAGDFAFWGLRFLLRGSLSLMPWVLGLVMVFYVVGIVSGLSMLGRAILCPATSPGSPRKEVSAWKLL